MELILKPSVACNFKCTFCSSTEIGDNPTSIVEIEKIKRFLIRFPETNTIIVNGGDPLMMKPEYYWDILKILDELNMDDTALSFTSNLWIFYKNPEPWVELFRHPKVGVSTSFQYGGARLKGDLTPFTEEEFWNVSDHMLKLVGYRPDFIAVIDEANQDTAIDTVMLAKAMGVVCKLNYANASGKPTTFKGITIGNAGKVFGLPEIYKKYLEIYSLGLAPWEWNTQQMVKKLKGRDTCCPLNRDCDTGIRSLQPDDRYFSCGSFGDDNLYGIDFEEEMGGGFIKPLQQYELMSMHDGCFSCEMFAICNGCKKHIHDVKELGLVEKHCAGMKGILNSAIAANLIDT